APAPAPVPAAAPAPGRENLWSGRVDFGRPRPTYRVKAAVRRAAARTEGGPNHAVHGAGEGDRGVRGGRHAHRRAPRGDGQVQRGAGPGRRDAGRGGAAPELEGSPDHVLRREAHGDGRTVHRGQGARGRVLAAPGEVLGGG